MLCSARRRERESPAPSPWWLGLMISLQCQCVLGPWGSSKKQSTPPICQQVQVCLIAFLPTLPLLPLAGMLGPSVPPSLASPAAQVTQNSSVQPTSAGMVSIWEGCDKGWASFAGALLRVQTFFPLPLPKYHFPLTPLQPANPPITTLTAVLFY